MSDSEKDDIPMLSNLQLSDECTNSRSQPFKSRNRSVSMSISSGGSYDGSKFVASPLQSERKTLMAQMSGPPNLGLRTDSLFHRNQNATVLRIYDPEKERNYSSFKEKDQADSSDDDYAGANEHLYRSGPLGICNDPYCTTCPTYSRFDEKQHRSGFDSKLQNILYGDAKGWSERIFSLLESYVPGVMNPHAKLIKRWNQFFVISCLVSYFLDPLFFFLLYVHKENKCISINWHMTTINVVFRSITDVIYLLNMLLQFRLAYVSPESTVVGVGDLIDHPKKIARHYLTGYFLFDLFVAFPLPQIMIMLLLVLPKSMGLPGVTLYLLFTAIFVQDGLRLIRFLRFLAAQSGSVSLTDWAFAKFHRNLIIFVSSSHIAGSCWYLFGLERVSQCLEDACHDSGFSFCSQLIHCEYWNKSGSRFNAWKNNTKADSCFTQDGFTYGIFGAAVNLSTDHSFFTKYLYSLFWGFQQISTMAGNQSPSYFVGEILFTMAIIALGILSLALLIGNLQNFLQGLGQRTIEMSMRRRVVAQWMSDRRLPPDIQREVREAESFRWVATRGVNEETLLEDLPEDLQRRIRRHLFTDFFRRLYIFSIIKDDRVLDSFCERVKQKTYIKGSKILDRNGIVEKMVFIVRGSMESVGEDGIIIPLREGDACGEELLTWCVENFAVNRGINKDSEGTMTTRRSKTSVKCVTNVEAFTLCDEDIEETIRRFKSSFQNPRIQASIRYQSPYWRALAAKRIQLVWNHYRMRQRIRVHGGAAAYPADASTS